MSSDAEVLAPADAVGSVSGTDGSSGSTKLSQVSVSLEAGFAGGSGLGPGPNQSKEHNVTHTRKTAQSPEGNTALKKKNSRSQQKFSGQLTARFSNYS